MAPFLGCVINKETITGVMFEDGTRGTLYSCINDRSFTFSPLFLFSFASDLANGLAYLHAHHVAHGNLNSTVCVINRHWILKITGQYQVLLGAYELLKDTVCNIST